MSFIDASYFVTELNIPNSGDVDIAPRIQWFINKYEPLFLQKLMGYPLYKAFVAGMNAIAPATPPQRMLNIIYGTEYTDAQGFLQKWKGLIVTDSPVFNLSGGLVYKTPQYLTAGATVGLVPGATTATFDGTAGTDDWRGWTPIITRGQLIMKPGIDYSWDPAIGLLTLLKVGDKFGNPEDFFVQFQVRLDGPPPASIDNSANESCIANYVYYWYRRSNVTQYSGIGEVMTGAENSVQANPRKKIASAWNEMHRWVKEFCAFMQTTQNADATMYPEWTLVNEHDALRHFAFMNPIF